MYLTRLDHKEKEYFLELAHYVANVDKDFSQTEQDLIIIYCREMGIKKYEIKSIDFDNIVKYFAKKTTKNIVMLEILALVFMDGDYNLAEKEFISRIQKVFGFTNEKMNDFIQWTKAVIKERDGGLSPSGDTWKGDWPFQVFPEQ